MQNSMKTFIAAILLVWTTCCLPSKPGGPMIRPSEGSLDQWFYSIGVMQYGNDKIEVDRLLAKSSFCGTEFELRPTAWSIDWPAPPTQGPYYGVFPRSSQEQGHQWVLVLAGEKGRMTHALVRVLSGTGVSLVPLAGDPRTLECVRSLQSTEETIFADYYWGKERYLESILQTARSVDSLKRDIDALFAEEPVGAWSFLKATEPSQRFRDSAGGGSFITCDFERDLVWDAIYAVRLSREFTDVFEASGKRRAPARQLSDTDWKLDTLANIYTQEGRIQGVLVKRSTFPGCLPYPFSKLSKCRAGGESLYAYQPYEYILRRR